MPIKTKINYSYSHPVTFKSGNYTITTNGKDIKGYKLLPDDEFIRLIGSFQEEVINRSIKTNNVTTLQLFLDSVESFYSKHLHLYNSFIENNRMDPRKADVKHPENTRVLAAVSQNEVSPGADRKTNISLVTSNFSKALCNTNSIDDAINTVDKSIKLWGSSDKLYPRFQKPISTTIKSLNSWKKSDNMNLNIKRILISFKEPNGAFDSECLEIQKNFLKKSIPDFNNASQKEKSAYRVDQIIEIDSSAPENIEKGFQLASKFVKEEKEKAKLTAMEYAKLTGKNKSEQELAGDIASNSLIFEGFAGWYGHGSIIKDKDPLGDAIFLEGSREFNFNSSNLSETKIKELEIKYLNNNNFRYFVHYYDGCRSGAIIA